MTIPSGTRLGPYEVLDLAGAGGMGEVYRARDTRLGREVAIKILPSRMAADHERLVRFEKEARLASALNHPNIVTIYDVGEANSIPYIAMELVSGKTLREILRAGALPLGQVVSIALQMADGLAKAHDGGIVHRDLKPENVMITDDGFVKILDFGLGKHMLGESCDPATAPTIAANSEMTGPGTILGTVDYMSPEQAAGRDADFHSDQFSFGSILYEMTTGCLPFHRQTAVQTMSAIIAEPQQSPIVLNPSAPGPLGDVIDRCLRKQPGKRYASTRELLAELRALPSLPSAGPRKLSKVELRKYGRTWIRPRSRSIAIAAVLALIAAGALTPPVRQGLLGRPKILEPLPPSKNVVPCRFAPSTALTTISATSTV